ncbi:hypothetical protein CIB95_11780 [Lottiidibacillus patelloidae]|uniref:Uncharacterized protein n=1 Tax=Lottiidibacillus patelloidae TaxID=2670334 RepID=A0A263BS96_9BACI|nr:hypothetical protein [Lottiidibacillus patelloidae]OZM56448.1 hypothetical protein CIB95_11780 [Lottiidibacillus patelloidae]
MKFIKNKKIAVIASSSLLLLISSIIIYSFFNSNTDTPTNTEPSDEGITDTYSVEQSLTVNPNVLHLKQGESAEIAEVFATVTNLSNSDKEMLNILEDNDRVDDFEISISSENVIRIEKTETSIFITVMDTVTENYAILTIKATVDGETVSAEITVNITDIPGAVTIETAVKQYNGISEALKALGTEQGWNYETSLKGADYLLIEKTARNFVTVSFFEKELLADKTVIHQLVGTEEVKNGTSPIPNGLSPDIRAELIKEDELNATVYTLIFDTELGTGGKYFTFTLIREGASWKVDTYKVTEGDLKLTWEEAKKYLSKITNESVVKKGTPENMKEEKNESGEKVFFFTIKESNYEMNRQTGKITEIIEETSEETEESDETETTEPSDPPKQKMTASDYMKLRANFHAAMIGLGSKNGWNTDRPLTADEYNIVKKEALKYITESYYNYLRDQKVHYDMKEVALFNVLLGYQVDFENRYHHRRLGIDVGVGHLKVREQGSNYIIYTRIDFPYRVDPNLFFMDEAYKTNYRFVKRNGVWLIDSMLSYNATHYPVEMNWEEAKLYLERDLHWPTLTKVGKETTNNGEVFTFTVDGESYSIRIKDMHVFDQYGHKLPDPMLLQYMNE